MTEIHLAGWGKSGFGTSVIEHGDISDEFSHPSTEDADYPLEWIESRLDSSMGERVHRLKIIRVSQPFFWRHFKVDGPMSNKLLEITNTLVCRVSAADYTTKKLPQKPP